MNDRDTPQSMQDTVRTLEGYLFKHRPDDRWSVAEGAGHQLVSTKWPYRVPLTVYRNMVEEVRGC